jgi:hypothetical protein
MANTSQDQQRSLDILKLKLESLKNENISLQDDIIERSATVK